MHSFLVRFSVRGFPYEQTVTCGSSIGARQYIKSVFPGCHIVESQRHSDSKVDQPF